MDFLPETTEKIIMDYKNQLEITEKYKKCLKELKNYKHPFIYKLNEHCCQRVLEIYNKDNLEDYIKGIYDNGYFQEYDDNGYYNHSNPEYMNTEIIFNIFFYQFDY